MKKKPFYKQTWFLIIAGVLVLGAMFSGGNTDVDTPKETPLKVEEPKKQPASSKAEKTPVKVQETTPEPKPEPKPEPAPTPPPAPAEPTETMGQKNAVGSAKNYLSFTAFSRSGLIKQLEFEGFSTEDSTYAVDKLAPNWNEQAVKSAKNYLSFMSFSRPGLIEQLEFEGFSTDQATYGAEQNGY